jgi:hypothetical protein
LGWVEVGTGDVEFWVVGAVFEGVSHHGSNTDIVGQSVHVGGQGGLRQRTFYAELEA